MSRIRKILSESESFLKKQGIQSARHDSEFLLASLVGCRRSDLYVGEKIKIDEPLLKKFHGHVARRGSREPLQYIIGHVEFHDLTLAVDKNVLIPRHETEELVAILCERIKAERCNKILDLGTGSGTIALAIGKAFPAAHIVASDVSCAAITIAKQNAQNNKVSNVKFVESDWFDRIYGQFDMIVSNPPYLSKHEFDNAEDEIRLFEPPSALISEKDGYAHIFHIISAAREFLTAQGKLFIETGNSQHQRIREFSQPFFNTFTSIRDLSGRDRFVVLNGF